MRTRLTFLNAAVIAASIILLILAANPGTAAWSPDTEPATGLVAGSEGNVTAQVVPGDYDLSFREWRSGVLEPVTSLPVWGGPVVLFAHVQDIDGNPAPHGGAVTFEYCGNHDPKEICEAGLARWTRAAKISIGSCYCRSCGGLPGYDPGPGNACFFDTGTGNVAGDDGFRFRYDGGRRSPVDKGMSAAVNFTWTPAL